MAPGLLCDERLWAPVRERLSLPATVVDLGPCKSLEAMAQELVGAAPQPAVLVGFSMGGMASILAASLAPQRFAALVILDTHVEGDTAERRQARLDQIDAAQNQRAFEHLVRGLATVYWSDPVADTAIAGLVNDMAVGQGRQVFARHVRAIMERPDLAAAASNLRLPVHVVCGREDRIAPPDLAARMAGLIPGAQLTVIDRCGHMAPLDRPDAVADIIRRIAKAP